MDELASFIGSNSSKKTLHLEGFFWNRKNLVPAFDSIIGSRT